MSALTRARRLRSSLRIGAAPRSVVLLVAALSTLALFAVVSFQTGSDMAETPTPEDQAPEQPSQPVLPQDPLPQDPTAPDELPLGPLVEPPPPDAGDTPVFPFPDQGELTTPSYEPDLPLPDQSSPSVDPAARWRTPIDRDSSAGSFSSASSIQIRICFRPACFLRRQHHHRAG